MGFVPSVPILRPILRPSVPILRRPSVPILRRPPFFVRGERLKGADGVYFKELKLTPDGERTAISHRKKVEGFRKELPKLVNEANAVAAEIADYQKKNSSEER